jgi:hypothetical protein
MLESLGHGRTGESDDAYPRVFHRRLSRTLLQSNPDIARILRADIMEPQSGEQTGDAMRDTLENLDQGLMLGRGGIGMHVHAPADPDNIAFPMKPAQRLRMEPVLLEITDPYEALSPNEFEQGVFSGLLLAHV